jgi:hypothetical protein
LRKQVDVLIAGDSIVPERMLAHVGTPTEPQPLGKLAKKLSDSTAVIQKIEKTLFPERYKKTESKDASKPAPTQ